MHTLLYFFQVLSIAQFITTSQSLLEALTPCVLTASDGDVVQAYCEETITPCILTASNGAIVQAYCEPSLVTQLFASITGISAPRNTNGTTSNFQILAASSNTILHNGNSNSSTSTAISLSANAVPFTTSSIPFSFNSTTTPPLAILTQTSADTTSQPSAQASPTTAFLASTTLAGDTAAYCAPDAQPDFDEAGFCTCSDGNTYAIQTQGSTPASLYNPCPYTSGSTPKTTLGPYISDCEFDENPANCSTTTDLNIQSIINAADATYVAEEIANCSNLTAYAGYPGANGAAAGDSCIEYFNITSHMLWWWGVNEDSCNNLNVGFANCFFDLTFQTNSNCSDLSANWYCSEPTAKDFSGVNATLDFYTAWNIYNFATWSFSYYTAMQYAYSYTSAMIWNDTLAFEQIKGSFPIGMEVLLGLCTFVLGIISPSGWGKTLPGEGGATAVNAAIEGGQAASTEASQLSAWILSKIFTPEVPGEYLLRAAQQTPGLLHAILVPAETGTINAAIMTSAALTAQLAEFAQALSQIIEDVAVNVPNNVTAFAEWTSGGYYMVEPLMTEQDMVTYIKWGLNTYVISQILQADNVFITRQVDTNPYELQTNASADNLSKPSIIGCKDGYNDWNQCGEFWWDSTNNVAYALSSTSDLWNSYSNDLTTIFNYNLTTPELLFLGSQACQDGYNATANDSPYQNAASGMVGQTTACLSNMAVCTWNLANGSYEFVEPWCATDGYAQSDWDFQDCAADMVDVPRGYLGYYLFNGATCESEE